MGGAAKMRSSRYQRRALFIISDGGDNHSRYGLKEIKSLVQEAGVDVYAIGIFNSLVPFRSFEEFMGKRWLGEITDKTGGRTVAVLGEGDDDGQAVGHDVVQVVGDALALDPGVEVEDVDVPGAGRIGLAGNRACPCTAQRGWPFEVAARVIGTPARCCDLTRC